MGKWIFGKGQAEIQRKKKIINQRFEREKDRIYFWGEFRREN